MVKEAIGYGATIEEAKEDAISKLNASELDDIQFDVLAMPKKKVLGLFGGSNAQVRAFIEIKEKKTYVLFSNATLNKIFVLITILAIIAVITSGVLVSRGNINNNK